MRVPSSQAYYIGPRFLKVRPFIVDFVSWWYIGRATIVKDHKELTSKGGKWKFHSPHDTRGRTKGLSLWDYHDIPPPARSELHLETFLLLLHPDPLCGSTREERESKQHTVKG